MLEHILYVGFFAFIALVVYFEGDTTVALVIAGIALFVAFGIILSRLDKINKNIQDIGKK